MFTKTGTSEAMLEGIRNSTSGQGGRSIRLGQHTSVVESRDSPSSLFHYFELITDKTDKSDKVDKVDKCDKSDECDKYDTADKSDKVDKADKRYNVCVISRQAMCARIHRQSYKGKLSARNCKAANLM